MSTRKLTKTKVKGSGKAHMYPKKAAAPKAAAQAPATSAPEETPAAAQASPLSSTADTAGATGNGHDPILDPGASPFNSVQPVRDRLAVAPPAAAQPEPDNDHTGGDYSDADSLNQTGNSAGDHNAGSGGTQAAASPAPAAPAPEFRAPRFRSSGGLSEEEMIRRQMAGSFDDFSSPGSAAAGANASPSDNGLAGELGASVGKGTASFILDLTGTLVDMGFQEVSQLPEGQIDAEVKDNRPEIRMEVMDSVRDYNAMVSRQTYWGKKHRALLEGPLTEYLKVSGWGDMTPGAQLGLACLMVMIMLFLDMKKLMKERNAQFQLIMDQLAKPANVVTPNVSA